MPFYYTNFDWNLPSGDKLKDPAMRHDKEYRLTVPVLKHIGVCPPKNKLFV